MSDAPPAPPAPSPAPTDLATRSDKVPVAFGSAPGSLDEGWRWAQQAAQSTLVPKAYFGKPHDILTALQMGIEVGLPPMTALQSIAVINGRPALWGDGLLALIMASPVYVDHDEYYQVGEGAAAVRTDALTPEDLKRDATRAVCTFVRKGKAEPVTKAFSVAQAKKANLLGKEGPWQQYPDRMLQMRARGFAARDAFPDVLKGLRTVEEVRDIPDTEIIEHAPTVQRRSARLDAPRQVAAAPELATAAPAPVPSPEPEPKADVLLTASVHTVQKRRGGAVVHLTTGQELDVQAGDTEDAITELGKFAGTDHQVAFTCRQTGDRLRLVDFRIAE